MNIRTKIEEWTEMSLWFLFCLVDETAQKVSEVKRGLGRIIRR